MKNHLKLTLPLTFVVMGGASFKFDIAKDYQSLDKYAYGLPIPWLVNSGITSGGTIIFALNLTLSFLLLFFLISLFSSKFSRSNTLKVINLTSSSLWIAAIFPLLTLATFFISPTFFRFVNPLDFIDINSIPSLILLALI